MFNVIARKTLYHYFDRYPDSKTALEKWYLEIRKEDFYNFNDLKKRFPDASIIGDDRVVLNILGNKYRLIVRMVFDFKAIQIKWLGSHAEYDKITAKTVKYKKP